MIALAIVAAVSWLAIVLVCGIAAGKVIHAGNVHLGDGPGGGDGCEQ